MKSRSRIYVGYSDNIKGYKVYYPDENKVCIEREIIFTPSNTHSGEGDVAVAEKIISLDLEELKGDKGNESKMEQQQEGDKDLQINSSLVSSQNLNSSESEPTTNNTQTTCEGQGIFDKERDSRLRTTNLLRRPKQFDNYDLSYFSVDVDEPTTYEDAMAMANESSWRKAVDKEMKALEENNTVGDQDGKKGDINVDLLLEVFNKMSLKKFMRQL